MGPHCQSNTASELRGLTFNNPAVDGRVRFIHIERFNRKSQRSLPRGKKSLLSDKLFDVNFCFSFLWRNPGEVMYKKKNSLTLCLYIFTSWLNYKRKHGFVIGVMSMYPLICQRCNCTDRMIRSLVNWGLLTVQMWEFSSKLWCNGQI